MRKTIVAALFITAGSLAMPALAGGHDPYRRGGGDAEAKAYNHNDNTAYGGHAKAYGGKAYSHSDSTAYGGTAYGGQGGTAYGGHGGTAYGGQGGKGGQGGHGGAGGSAYSDANVENSNNASQNVNVEAQQRNPVSTAYAPPLAVGEDTCMGSSSVGGQGVGFGISFGTTWTDENCQRLKNSRQLAALGYRKASVALLCVNDDVARAMAAAGLPCRVQHGRGYELTTAALPSDTPAYVPPPQPPRVIYSRTVEERRHYTPRHHVAPKKHKPKKVRCRMVRQCTR
jgi:hypothetical protein